MKSAFFTESLREVRLHPTPQLKLNAQREKRIKINFAMVCTEDNLEGAPEEVVTAFNDVGAISQGIQKCIISSEFERVNMELHPLADKPAAIEISDCTMRALNVSRKIKENSPNDVVLQMCTTVPSSKKLKDYCGDNGGATIWVKFEQTQALLSADDPPAASQGTSFEGAAASAPKDD